MAWAGGTLVAQGGVTVRFPGGFLRAQSLQADSATRQVRLQGPVQVEARELSAQAQSASLDGSTGRLSLTEAQGQWRGWRLGGALLESHGESLSLSAGWLARCAHEDPDLLLRLEGAQLSRLGPGRTGLALQGLKLEAAGLPLLWWPGLQLEARDPDEPFGLSLEPRVGSDAYRGAFLELRPFWPLGEWGRISAPLSISSLRGGSLGLVHAWEQGEALAWRGEALAESPWVAGRGGLRASAEFSGTALAGWNWALRGAYREDIRGVPVSKGPELALSGAGWRLGRLRGNWEASTGLVGEAETGLWAGRARAAAQGQWPLARLGALRLGLEGRGSLAGYETARLNGTHGQAEAAAGLRAEWGGGAQWGLWGLAEQRAQWGQSPFLHDRSYGGERLALGLALPLGEAWAARAEGSLGRLGAGSFGPEDAALTLGHQWRCFALEATYRPLLDGLSLGIRGIGF